MDLTTIPFIEHHKINHMIANMLAVYAQRKSKLRLKIGNLLGLFHGQEPVTVVSLRDRLVNMPRKTTRALIVVFVHLVYPYPKFQTLSPCP
jgi:hypothetical protein